MRWRVRTWVAAGILAAVLVHTGPRSHSRRRDPGEIRGLKLGLEAQSMTLRRFR